MYIRSRVLFSALALAAVGPFALAASSTPGAAQEEAASPAQNIVEYRHSLMTSLGANAAALSKILRQEVPFQDQALGHVKAIAALSGYVPAAFPEGSGYDDHPEDNAALPEIWTRRDDFEQAAQRLDEAAQVLLAAAEGGNRGEIIRAFAQVGQACSACHDTFRYRD